MTIQSLTIEQLQSLSPNRFGYATPLPELLETAAKALKQAQDYAKQEPFAYVIWAGDHWEINNSRNGTPVFVFPPNRQPLTSEQIQKIANDIRIVNVPSFMVEAFARGLEKAHQIGE